MAYQKLMSKRTSQHYITPLPCILQLKPFDHTPQAGYLRQIMNTNLKGSLLPFFFWKSVTLFTPALQIQIEYRMQTLNYEEPSQEALLSQWISFFLFFHTFVHLIACRSKSKRQEAKELSREEVETVASSMYSSLLTTDMNRGIHDSWNTNTTTDSCRKERDARAHTRSSYPSAVISKIMNNTRKSIKTMILQFCLLIKMIKLVKLTPSSHGYCDR